MASYTLGIADAVGTAGVNSMLHMPRLSVLHGAKKKTSAFVRDNELSRRQAEAAPPPKASECGKR